MLADAHGPAALLARGRRRSPRRIESMARIRDLATALMTVAAVLAPMAPGKVVAATTYDVISDVRIPMSDGVLLTPTNTCPRRGARARPSWCRRRIANRARECPRATRYFPPT